MKKLFRLLIILFLLPFFYCCLCSKSKGTTVFQDSTTIKYDKFFDHYVVKDIYGSTKATIKYDKFFDHYVVKDIYGSTKTTIKLNGKMRNEWELKLKK